MPACAPVEEKPAVEKQKLEIQAELLNLSFPEKSGFKRKIHHLWGNFYRVNFHSLNNGGIESCFVRIDGREVTRYSEPKKEPD